MRVAGIRIGLAIWLLLMLAGCASSTVQQGGATGQAALGERLTYVAMGASDTFGTGSDDPYKDNWAADLAKKLGPRYRLINLGVPSITLQEALTIELPVALDAHPDLVTIWLAVNDISARVPVKAYMHDLDQLLSRLQTGMPRARIAVANVPDLTLLPVFAGQKKVSQSALQAQIQAYNDAIATSVKAHHALLIDLAQYNKDLKQHPEYVGQDGLHPSVDGYARLADLFYQSLLPFKTDQKETGDSAVASLATRLNLAEKTAYIDFA